MPKVSLKKKLLLLSNLLIAAAVVVLIIGIGKNRKQHRDNQVSPSSLTANQTSTEVAPSTERPPDDIFKNYRVPPDAPRYLFIPKISVKAMVKPVGLTRTNQIESPRNVFDVGWYSNSAKPGQPGAIVVDGHVSSWETNGVFYALKSVKAGDIVTIERGDGVVITYKVVRSQIYDADKVDMPAALAPINPRKPGLNLITCTGKVIKDTNDFDKRLVVFAEQT